MRTLAQNLRRAFHYSNLSDISRKGTDFSLYQIRKKLSQTLNNFRLPGVGFVPKNFTPVVIPGKSERPKYKNQKCQGIEVWITNRDIYRSIDTGILTLFSIYNMYPEKIKIKENGLNRLWGSNTLFEKLTRGATTEELLDY